jgi:hypothetical protein
MGGCDDSNVDLNGRGSADFGEFALLKDAEKLDLRVEREFTDFVEEEGSAVGGFDSAGLVGEGAGEGTAHVSEEFGLDEIFGNSTAVDCDE